MGCVYAYGKRLSVPILTTVIVLVMIGPEERKADPVQEHAAAHHHLGAEDPSDWEKVHAEGADRQRAPSETTLEEEQQKKFTNAEKLSNEV